MKTSILLTTAVCTMLLLSLPPAAARADEAAPQYLLGTTLVMTSATPLANPPSNYWGDLLPVEYRFGQCYIVDAINAARTARGESVMIDVTKWPIAVGGETQNADGQWEYTMDFLLMQPADVDAALAKFPLSGPMAGFKQSYREVGNGYFYGDAQGSSLTLDVLGHKIALSTSDSVAAMQEKLLGELKQLFGDSAKFDLSVGAYTSAYGGSSNFNVSVSVYLNDAQPQYYGEGGM